MVIKSQALTNFVTKFTHDVVPEPEVTLPEVETPKKQNLDKNIVKWKLFVDGSSNQHGCGADLFFKPH